MAAEPGEEPTETTQGASSRLFDLRHLIGALFSLYGVVLVVASPFVDDTKAGGRDVDLWLGLGMLALGLFFVAWARTRPLRLEGESARARAEHEARDRREG